MYTDSRYIINGNSTIPSVRKLEGDDLYNQAQYFIENAKSVAFLTGAGISTGAGIPDFRSKTGWYSKSPSDILSHNNFFNKPKEVCEFLYKYYSLIDVEPTLSHKLIAKLQEHKDIYVITQNVDMLHTKAGSKNVLEYHGSFKEAKCYKCKKVYSIESILNEKVHTDEFSVKCSCRGYIKPDIVLFGEDVKHKKEALKIMKKVDLVVIVGTSLNVAPFSELPLKCYFDTPYIIINKSPTELDNNRMSVVIREDCDVALQRILQTAIV